MIYDLVIIGAGPAGMTAAIYSARQKLKTLVITKNFGGQMCNKAVDIENYPGFNKISGFDLILKMEDQVRNKEVEILNDEVVDLKNDNDIFSISTKEGKNIESKIVIIATGAKPRKLDVLGEEKFLGKGVSYCSTCDGPLFKNKDVVVVGGGDAGFETAIFLKKYANKIYLLESGSEVRASRENQEKAQGIEIITSAKLKEIKGEDFVTQIVIEKDNQEKTIDVKGVFVQAGYVPATQFLNDLVDLNERKEVMVNLETFETKTKKLYAVGDINCQKVKQIIIACGQGAQAVINACKYLD